MNPGHAGNFFKFSVHRTQPQKQQMFSEFMFGVFTVVFRKASTWLGQRYNRGIALEVIPLAYIPVMTKVQKMFGGSIELRMAKSKAVCYSY